MPGTLLRSGDEIGLAQHEIGFLPICEAQRATKTEDPVIAGIYDVKSGRIGSGIESHTLRIQKLPALYQIRIDIGYLYRILPDGTGRDGI